MYLVGQNDVILPGLWSSDSEETFLSSSSIELRLGDDRIREVISETIARVSLRSWLILTVS